MTDISTYADRQLGMWAFGFDNEAKERLNTVHAALWATIPASEQAAMKQEEETRRQETLRREPNAVFSDEYDVTWTIDEAEKRGVCSTEEAAYLREHFVNDDNGLPRVLHLA